MKPSHRIFIIFLTDKALMFYSNNKAQIKIFWNLCGSCQKSSHAPVSGQRPDLGAIVWNSFCVYGLMFSFWEMKMEIRGLCNRFSQHLTQSSIWSRGIYIYQLTSLHCFRTIYLIFCDPSFLAARISTTGKPCIICWISCSWFCTTLTWFWCLRSDIATI